MVRAFVMHAVLDLKSIPTLQIPGLGGSVLESKLHNVTQPHSICSGDHDWQVHMRWLPQRASRRAIVLTHGIRHSRSRSSLQVEWVAPSKELALIDCLLNVLTLRYDPETGRYSNNTGVEIRPYKFGGDAGVASLDPQVL